MVWRYSGTSVAKRYARSDLARAARGPAPRPIERATRLTTLVVHTAGSRLNAVALSGLDQDDAERLRDRLARQLDHDDDAL